MEKVGAVVSTEHFVDISKQLTFNIILFTIRLRSLWYDMDGSSLSGNKLTHTRDLLANTPFENPNSKNLRFSITSQGRWRMCQHHNTHYLS